VEEDEELALNLPLLKEIDIRKKNEGEKLSKKELNARVLMESKEISTEGVALKISTDNTNIALEQLGIILSNQSLRDIHKTVLESFTYIIEKLKEGTKGYLSLMLPPLLVLIRKTSDDGLRREGFIVLK
jgi:hypothetical protein